MHKIRFKPLIIVLLLSIFCQFTLARPDKRPELLLIKDARDTAQLAKSRNLPILIMFGTDECPYCELLREDFLIPMIISGHYTDKIILREAHVSYGENIINFAGKKVSIYDFAAQYGVRLFPTMVFVDDQGKPLVNKIIGITTPSLFGGTLDDSIDKALTLTIKNTILVNKGLGNK